MEVNPAFDVVIAYEDLETGKHAKKTYDFLLEHLGLNCQFTNQMWKFDVLNIPKLCDMAARDAAAADIVIISCHGRTDLPQQVKTWIEKWQVEKGNAIALVALFDSPNENIHQTLEIREFLCGVAKAAHMEFFAQPDDWPGKRSTEERFALTEPTEQIGRALSTLAGMVDTNLPRWGSE